MKKRKFITAIILIIALVLSPMIQNNVVTATKKEVHTLSNPKTENRQISLKVGDVYKLRVLPKSYAKFGWHLEKVTTSNKKFVEVFDMNSKDLTVKIRGKQKSSKVIIKTTLKMKKASWKKYKKYAKSRKKVLKYTVDVSELKKIDTTNWKIDTISFTYDKQAHLPKILNVQENVKVTYSCAPQVDVGIYKLKVSFEVPKGYEQIPNISVTFRIEKAVIDISNICFDDKVTNYIPGEHYSLYFPNTLLPEGVKLSQYIVNGQIMPLDYNVTDPGTYKIEPVFELSDEKNYKLIGEVKVATLTIAYEKPEVEQTPLPTPTPSTNLNEKPEDSSSNNSDANNGESLGWIFGGGSISKPEEKPVTTPEPEPSNPDTEQKPEKHVFGAWVSKNENEHERECSHCGIKETQKHTLECMEEVVFEDNQDNTHTVKRTYFCKDCNYTCVDANKEDCMYGKWQYIGQETEETLCEKCKHKKTREHQHQQEPQNLEYIYESSNNDGTHKLQSSYTCEICKKVIIVSKNEECDYEITYEKEQIDDIHNKIKDCKVCLYHIEEQQECEPEGEKTAIKEEDGFVYEYYVCGLCEDECRYQKHTQHEFGAWEYRDRDNHIRYCFCIEERQTENHKYSNEVDGMGNMIFTCADCGGTKVVEEHDHGYGVKNDMEYMDLVMSPAFQERLTNNFVANPIKAPDVYCCKMDFRCNKCGIIYTVYNQHKFVDGVCTRKNFCGGVQQAA